MTTTRDSQGITRIVIIIAGVIVILAGMRLASSIIGPLLAAIFFAILFGMFMRWLEGKGAPHWLAVTITLISVLAVIAGFFLLIAASFAQLVAQVPEYQAGIETTLTPLLSEAGVPVPTLSSVLAALSDYTVTAVSGIVSSVTTMALITIATLFLLFEAESYAAKIGAMLAERPGVREQFMDLRQKIIGYVVIRTEVNLVTGLGIGVVIAAVGVEYAAVWGFLAFALSYIPYIGFWLAVIPPMLIAWAELGAAQAIIILVGAAVINILAENVLFPQAAGKGLKVSPTVVFVSLVVWSFVLGSLGALLAVPLTLALVMFLEFFDETRWIGFLLSPAVPVQPESEPEPPERGRAAPELRD
jgi:AI-2 transport protein TqsA